MSWSIYKLERPPAPLTEPAVTIDASGRIRLSKSLVEIFGTNWKYCQLLYDAEEHQLGIKLVHSDTEFALPLGYEVTGAAHVSGKSFCHWAKIDHSRARRFRATYDESKRIIVVDMQRGEIAVRRPASKKGVAK